MNHLRWIARPVVLLALLLAATGCRTVHYRSVQHDFEQAVRADNEGSESPFTDWYANVIGDLTPDKIACLEARLRPNAWMLRAVAAWRTQQYRLARDSASAGLKDPNLKPHSRDDVILTMMDGLVVDAELFDRFQQGGRKVKATEHQAYAKDFKTALTVLDKARQKIKEPTPLSVQHYWHYQRWRILQNWSQVINAIDPTAVEAMQQATQEAKTFLGQELIAAIGAARDAIPADHPLHRLIRAREAGR